MHPSRRSDKRKVFIRSAGRHGFASLANEKGRTEPTVVALLGHSTGSVTRRYIATVELDEEAGLFHGEVVNTRDVLTFQGRTIIELKTAFADTIADYREWCRERGKEPEKPYSGSFTVRIGPELHRRIADAAARKGKSLNGFVAETLEHVA
ncbi:MAG: toxin-antitoxin system HicB family antitoxin [Magnetospirillum sp. WYHS-4]